MAVITGPQLTGQEGTDSEALFREAKRRERMRRLLVAAIVLIVVAGSLALVVAVNRGHGKNTPARVDLSYRRNSPSVDAKAFSGEGSLAFISRGTLFVLDGDTKSLQRVSLPAGFTPASPTFSPDGQWLAYTASRLTNAGQTTQVWIAAANGTHAHEVTGLLDPDLIGWNPRSDQIAVISSAPLTTRFGSAFDEASRLWSIAPRGRRHLVMTALSIEGAAWSPNGRQIAVSTSTFPSATDVSTWSSTLSVYPVSGGAPAVWLHLSNTTYFGGEKGNFVLPVEWIPNWGVAFWTIGDGAGPSDGSIQDGGGLDLFTQNGPGDSPRLLGSVLSNGTVQAVATTSTGELAITVDNGGAKPMWIDQSVENCSQATYQCTPVKKAAGTISLDPAWSADGSTLAYEVGKASQNEGFNQKYVSGWYDSLQLWLYRSSTDSRVMVPSARGAVVPSWSITGHSLLYVADDGIWVWKNLQGTPVEVVGPLLPPSNWNAFYGQIDWSNQFAWSRGIAGSSGS
jgi:hypothetical protein